MNRTPNADPKQRSICLIDRDGSWYLISIQDPRETTFYLLTPIPADFGVAFLVEKQDEQGTAATYRVNTGDRNHWPECDCAGHAYRGHCRHVTGIRALQQAGKLPGLAPLPAIRCGRDARHEPECVPGYFGTDGYPDDAA